MSDCKRKAWCRIRKGSKNPWRPTYLTIHIKHKTLLRTKRTFAKVSLGTKILRSHAMGQARTILLKITPSKSGSRKSKNSKMAFKKQSQNLILEPRNWKVMKNIWSIEHILLSKRLDFQTKSQSGKRRTKR